MHKNKNRHWLLLRRLVKINVVGINQELSLILYYSLSTSFFEHSWGASDNEHLLCAGPEADAFRCVMCGMMGEGDMLQQFQCIVSFLKSRREIQFWLFFAKIFWPNHQTSCALPVTVLCKKSIKPDLRFLYLSTLAGP